MAPKRNKGIFAYVLIALLLMISVTVIMPYLYKSKESTEYSEIITHFDQYEVSTYTLDLGTGELFLKLKDSDKKIKYTVPNVSIFLDDTENYRQEYNKKNPDTPLSQDYYKITDSSWLLTVIPTVLLLVMGGFLFFFMIRQNGGGKYSSFARPTSRRRHSRQKKRRLTTLPARTRKSMKWRKS